MKCSKCNNEFEEKHLECSHDIPKYIGGTDKDGRHWLCGKCHTRYEKWIIKIGFLNYLQDKEGKGLIPIMNFIKNLPNSDKEKFKFSARMIKEGFFNGKEEDENIC